MRRFLNGKSKQAAFPSDGKTPLAVRDAGYSPVFYFGVTDAKAAARRAAIDRANCTRCHHDL